MFSPYYVSRCLLKISIFKIIKHLSVLRNKVTRVQRNNSSQMFFKINVLKDFAILTGKVLGYRLIKVGGLKASSGYIALKNLLYKIGI